MQLILQLVPFIVLLLLGWIVGTITEKRHYRRLRRREALIADAMILTEIKTFPGGAPGAKNPALVVGEAVIATDYLKSFLAAIRKILGGEVRSYLSLLQRARREALARMMESARDHGYDAVCNVRLETATIGGMTKKGVAMVGIIASGTAYHRAGNNSR